MWSRTTFVPLPSGVRENRTSEWARVPHLDPPRLDEARAGHELDVTTVNRATEQGEHAAVGRRDLGGAPARGLRELRAGGERREDAVG